MMAKLPKDSPNLQQKLECRAATGYRDLGHKLSRWCVCVWVILALIYFLKRILTSDLGCDSLGCACDDGYMHAPYLNDVA